MSEQLNSAGVQRIDMVGSYELGGIVHLHIKGAPTIRLELSKSLFNLLVVLLEAALEKREIPDLTYVAPTTLVRRIRKQTSATDRPLHTTRLSLNKLVYRLRDELGKLLGSPGRGLIESSQLGYRINVREGTIELT